MKNILLLTTFCLAIHSACSQPQFLNPKPSGFHNSKIVFTDAQTGFILNYNGDLIKTTNQGNTWELAYNFHYGGAFDAKDAVVIIGNSSGIYISTDTGKNFVRGLSTFPSGFMDIDIVSRDTIFALSLYTFYKSTDGGHSWKITNMGAVNQSCFDFIDSKIGFIGRTNTSMLKTVDGGQTWQPMLNHYNFSKECTAVKFLNRDIAFVWNSRDSVYKTVDCGVSWTGYPILDEGYGMSFPSNTDGYIVGEYGRVWTTTDAGATWSLGARAGIGLNVALSSVYFITPAIGFAVGSDGQILKTVDSGTTWLSNAITLGSIKALSFPTSNVGFVAPWYDLRAFKTTDGARNWVELRGMLQPTINRRSYEQVHFFSPDTGFFTASYPAVVYKTNDGGTTWREIKFFDTYQREYENNPEISVVGDSVVYLLLSNYYIGTGFFRSSDRGETWEKIDSTLSDAPRLSNIFFLSEKIGYAALGGYQLVKTNDGAKSWNVLKNHNERIQNIYFLNEAKGFMTDAQVMRRTADSGKTWPLQEVNGSQLTPTSISFADDKIGFFTTRNKEVLKTVNGGTSWQLFGYIPRESRVMARGKEGGVYIGGENGAINYLGADTSWESGWGTASACSGGNFTFIADAGRVYSSYQWQVNKDSSFTDIKDDGVYQGANTYSLKVHHVPVEWVNYQYRCKISNGEGIVYSKIYELRFKTEWTGAVDNNWENSGNWSCGLVPNKNTDVVIPFGTITLNQSTTVRSLQLSPSVSFTINPGVTLTVLH
jgi:photosystem II stability/assembly factor-like uncharacterized protein